jgi:hypothetical protein
VQYRHEYDPAGRLKTLTSRYGSASPVVDTRKYDAGSRQVGRTVMLGNTALRNDTLIYDLRNKLVGGAATATYDGRGRAIHTGFGDADETMTLDGFGNLRRKTGINVSPSSITYASEPWTGRLTQETSPLTGSHPDVTLYGNDYVSGNPLATTMLGEANYTPEGGVRCALLTRRSVNLSSYDDRNMLKQHQFVYDTLFAANVGPNFGDVRTNLTPTSRRRRTATTLWGRVWTRVLRDTLCTRDGSPEKFSGCTSPVTRTMWDGSQIIAEYQADGHPGTDPAGLESDNAFAPMFGVVNYILGDGLDHPLGVYKGDELVLPVSAWHGGYDKGVCGTSPCEVTHIAFPQRYAFGPRAPSVPPSWYGSLILGQQDASGNVYLRNRYYNPGHRAIHAGRPDRAGRGDESLWVWWRRPRQLQRPVWAVSEGRSLPTVYFWPLV